MNIIGRRFNEIVLKEIKMKIAEAFIGLEAELKDNKLIDLSEIDGGQIIQSKAASMKEEINSFIDTFTENIM